MSRALPFPGNSRQNDFTFPCSPSSGGDRGGRGKWMEGTFTDQKFTARASGGGCSGSGGVPFRVIYGPSRSRRSRSEKVGRNCHTYRVHCYQTSFSSCRFHYLKVQISYLSYAMPISKLLSLQLRIVRAREKCSNAMKSFISYTSVLKRKKKEASFVNRCRGARGRKTGRRERRENIHEKVKYYRLNGDDGAHALTDKICVSPLLREKYGNHILDLRRSC